MTDEKTNVMRLLDGKRVKYNAYTYPCPDGAVSGTEVARRTGRPEERVFKTLVTVGKSGQHYVFVIPVAAELHLKKAAQCAKEKSIEMIKSKDLLPLTGYVHGGCSPIGMKKRFPTFLHKTAEGLENIVFSAGKIGYQVELNPEDLKKLTPFAYGDLVDSEE